MHPPSDFLLIERINQCPKLASLRSINDTLRSLLESEDSFLAQIAEVIRLDPSLTTRVLDLVNSIFFGSKDNKRISGVEEASIFLGLNRIRELLFATPVIEEILYPAMEDYRLDIMIGEGPSARSVKLDGGMQRLVRTIYGTIIFQMKLWLRFIGTINLSNQRKVQSWQQPSRCLKQLFPNSGSLD